MTKKIRIGIIFGGKSKEREISFAGGRTVYDNLNKFLFEAVPIFVDSFGNFVELDWQFIYKGSIRDFYPPIQFLPSEGLFQLYAENLGDLNELEKDALIPQIGKKISLTDLKQKIDFAFLCLHGPYGEDGRIQGLFEFYQIPYSGSGVIASAIGIDKVLQKEMMINKGFNSPSYITIKRKDWIEGGEESPFNLVKEKIGFPCVVKPAHQGSSIGISILNVENEFEFMRAVEKAFFTRWIDATEWNGYSDEEKILYIKTLVDIKEGIGMPLVLSYPKDLQAPIIYNPSALLDFLNSHLKVDGFVVESLDAESTVLVEGFIEGKEFSCIVLEDEKGVAIALPPTEIIKGKELFDYRSKYLPGLSRKITPIDLPDAKIEAIRKACEKLFYDLHFDVYARIDGFLSTNGTIYLNDPNTTSGMMPSSFFFHQAAEIGLNPSQFLTFIIRTSIAKRLLQASGNINYKHLLHHLDDLLIKDKNLANNKKSVAIILGGYSSERHISVESGRNVFEKLASSEKYLPFPVFLTGSAKGYQMYQIPINLLLKDNADDIKEKIEQFKIHEVIKNIRLQCQTITDKFSATNDPKAPKKISFEDLKQNANQVFIALHGRPGEDGEIQEKLDAIALTYNGSPKESSAITIDKYKTNALLKANGFLVANHLLITKHDWANEKEKFTDILKNQIKFPFIAKPVDDGCSSAVKKIKNLQEFEAYCQLLFRNTEDLDVNAANLLRVKIKEEFPQKQVVLVEELITKKNAVNFLEITGGMLTHFDLNGHINYEVFEASETLVDGEVLSLEEKFLAGQGQNITPARYSKNDADRQNISEQVKISFGEVAKILGIRGYCRIDAFIRIFERCEIEIIFIEVNSLPGMTPATCIFHQAAINNYKPLEYIDKILDFGLKRLT